MTMRWDRLAAWLAERAKERSTWIGLTTALSGLGLAIAPERAEAIAALGVIIGGAIAAMTKDTKG